MKKQLVSLCIFLAGCSTPFVYKPAPEEPLIMQASARASGVLTPQALYFTLLSQYQPDHRARVVILAEPALKLADFTVTKEQIEVHDKQARVPVRLIRAWGDLVQKQFLTPCPPRKITHPARGVSGTFELEVTGGICQ